MPGRDLLVIAEIICGLWLDAAKKIGGWSFGAGPDRGNSRSRPFEAKVRDTSLRMLVSCAENRSSFRPIQRRRRKDVAVPGVAMSFIGWDVPSPRPKRLMLSNGRRSRHCGTLDFDFTAIVAIPKLSRCLKVSRTSRISSVAIPITPSVWRGRAAVNDGFRR